MHVDEISEAYRDEWVLLKITAMDRGWPTEGEVMAHSKRRSVVEKRLDDLLPALQTAGARYKIYQPYPLITTGAEMMALLNNLEGLDSDLVLRFR
jgi:hypothetical protein